MALSVRSALTELDTKRERCVVGSRALLLTSQRQRLATRGENLGPLQLEPGGAAAPRVRHYMTPNPQSLQVSDRLLDAVLLLRGANLRHIPILSDGRLVGLLTDRDVWRFSPTMLVPLPQHEYNRVFEETPVGKIMTRDPVTISSDAPLAEAVQLLSQNKLGCLPVVDQDQLVGIITMRDMLRALDDLIGSASAPSQ